MAEQKAERALERKEANSMGAWAAPGCLPHQRRRRWRRGRAVAAFGADRVAGDG